VEVAVFRRVLKARVYFVAIAARYLPQSQRVLTPICWGLGLTPSYRGL